MEAMVAVMEKESDVELEAVMVEDMEEEVMVDSVEAMAAV